MGFLALLETSSFTSLKPKEVFIKFSREIFVQHCKLNLSGFLENWEKMLVAFYIDISSGNSVHSVIIN